MALLAIWRHLPTKTAAAKFINIGICQWAIISAVHWGLFARRNFVFGRPFATAVVTPLSPAKPVLDMPASEAHPTLLQVDITVPRPWRVRAGQHVFLSIPGLGIFTGLRGHPFVIAWWDRDRSGLTISILVSSKNGFTRELSRNANKTFRAFIDGPFGIPHDFGAYGTVIMIATGIGIAGHMPYLKDLISGYNSCEVRTRRILLIWQIQNEGDYLSFTWQNSTY